jgi:hypothetical protein
MTTASSADKVVLQKGPTETLPLLAREIRDRGVSHDRNSIDTGSQPARKWALFWLSAYSKLYFYNKHLVVAEEAGFEPAIRFPVCTLSKRVP